MVHEITTITLNYPDFSWTTPSEASYMLAEQGEGKQAYLIVAEAVFPAQRFRQTEILCAAVVWL